MDWKFGSDEKLGSRATYHGRSATWAGHIHSLGASIVAPLHEVLDLLALSKAAETFGDDACLQPQCRQVRIMQEPQRADL